MVDSRSKTPVDRDQAEAVVEAAFGGSVGLVGATACEEGWFNAVHRLELDDGRHVVLKVAPPADVPVLRYEHDLLTTEVEALRLVGERTALPVPAVLAWDRTGEVLPSDWFLMAACPGRLLSELRTTLAPEAAAAVDGQLVRHLAALHGITGPTFGRPDRSAPKARAWSGGFLGLFDDLLADAADAAVDLPLPLDELRELVAEQADALDAVTTPRLVHWDLWDTNVFVDPETLEVVGLIDFERVLWGDPLMEAQFLGKRRTDETVEAYGTALFDEPHAVERRRLYDLYLALVMTVECAYRHYPTDDIEQLARPMLATAIEELR